MTHGHEQYCDHHWARDDANCEQCIHCGRRREVSDD